MMIRYKFLLREISLVALLFMGFWSWANAQPTIEWQKSLGGSFFDQAYSVKKTSDGGYVVVGSAASHNGDVFGNHGNDDFWIIKLHANGSLQWKRVYGGTAIDLALSVQQTMDGGYIVAGYTDSNDFDVTGNHGGIYDGWVLKLDASGLIQWKKAFGGSSWDDFWHIEQTSDGGYIMAGRSGSHDGDVTDNYGMLDVWVVKTNAGGDIEWQRNYGGTGNDNAYCVKQTPEGGYMVVCETASSDGDVTNNQGNVDVWALKLSASGDIEWQKALGGTGADVGSDFVFTDDGGYVIASYTGSVNTGDVIGNEQKGFLDYWIVKINSVGELQWQIPLGGTNPDYGRSIVHANGGGYLIVGTTKSFDGDVENLHDGAEVWLVKVSEEGQLVWQKSYGGSLKDDGFSIDNADDGGYIMAGFAFSTDGDVLGSNNFGGYNDYWIVKLSPESTPTTEPGLAGDAMQIFPNPTAEAVQLKVPMDINTMQVSITDIQGREVLKAEIANGGILDVKSLPTGVYQVAAKMDDKTLYFSKLEINR